MYFIAPSRCLLSWYNHPFWFLFYVLLYHVYKDVSFHAEMDDSILDALDSPAQTPIWPIGVANNFFELVYMVHGVIYCIQRS